MTPEQDRGRPDRADGDERPMLLLGEDRPDAEDTTLAELRAQEAELERARRDLAEQADRERERAERQLAAERRRAEQELARRQREIDDAERRLLRTERRLRRQATQQGRAITVPKVSTGLRDEHRTKNRLLRDARAESATRIPRRRTATTLAVTAGLCLALGTLLTGDRAGDDEVQRVTQLDATRADLRGATSLLDTELVGHATGMPVPLDDSGALPSVSVAQEILARTGIDGYGSERIDAVTPLLSDESVSPVRAATAWEDARDALAYTVTGYRVDQEIEEIAPGSGWGTALLWVGAALLVTAGVVVLLAGGWLAGAFLLLAALASLLLMTQDPRMSGWSTAAQAQAEAADRPQDLQDAVGRDLEVVVGLDSLASWQLADNAYWEGYSTLEKDLDPDGVVAAARLALGEALSAEASDAELRRAALGVIVAADEARVPLEADAVAARESLMSRAVEAPSGTTIALGLGLGLLLPLVGFGAETVVRRRKEAS